MSLDLKNKTIGVLMGGVSREREISLRSGKNVAQALEKLGYKIKILDIKHRDCKQILKNSGIEIAYNILHGEFGEDGEIQFILEELKIPYTGSGVIASRDCMNKVLCKKILTEHKLPTAEYEEPASAAEITLPATLVIKPKEEGSSFGITIVQENAQIAEVFNKTASEFGGEVFIERYIPGAEVTVGVIKDGHKIIPLPILELVPKNKFYDFESKYTPGGTRFILPANLSEQVTKKVQDLAVQTYKLMRCDSGIRVDFIIENRLKPYILEVNTIPGMTDQSDLPAEAQAAGISFPELVEKILATAALNKY